MKEREVELKLKKDVEGIGGFCLKFTSPGMAGMPDRLVLFPRGRLFFVELKAPGEKLRPLQLKRKEQLEKLGFKVYVIDSYRSIELFLQEVMA
ncbi:VRR-NUC domain-containing protein [Proteinivorax hydrogeniformans]|uniref:VRR-NUC domain-containing protein n=1 Tax=Proteinivorax hydrogeniformans TaxID=1826727 RepID=A0AAU8HT82_9FIRM